MGVSTMSGIWEAQRTVGCVDRGCENEGCSYWDPAPPRDPEPDTASHHSPGTSQLQTSAGACTCRARSTCHTSTDGSWATSRLVHHKLDFDSRFGAGQTLSNNACQIPLDRPPNPCHPPPGCSRASTRLFQLTRWITPISIPLWEHIWCVCFSSGHCLPLVS
jgi:hypothetical protein